MAKDKQTHEQVAKATERREYVTLSFGGIDGQLLPPGTVLRLTDTEHARYTAAPYKVELQRMGDATDLQPIMAKLDADQRRRVHAFALQLLTEGKD